MRIHRAWSVFTRAYTSVGTCWHSPILLFLLQSKRKDSEPRTKCLLNNADLAPHHPKDPVEMRRINFQTPGVCLPQVPGTALPGGRTLPAATSPASPHCLVQSIPDSQLPTCSRLGTHMGWFCLQPHEAFAVFCGELKGRVKTTKPSSFLLAERAMLLFTPLVLRPLGLFHTPWDVPLARH